MVMKWNIYWTRLNPIEGSEQAGTRPCLVISNDIVNKVLPVVTILPISSVKKDSKVYPTEVFLEMSISGLNKDSVVMAHQIRTVSKQRLCEQCGEIKNTEVMNKINQCLMEYFELY